VSLSPLPPDTLSWNLVVPGGTHATGTCPPGSSGCRRSPRQPRHPQPVGPPSSRSQWP